METALKAIAAPRRRAILRLVRDDELSAGEIASHFDDVTRPAVSQHLTLLKEAGLVDERRNGTRRLYRARPEGLAELREFLEEFWDARLEALKREAEQEQRRKDGARLTGCLPARGPDRGRPGDGVGVPRRPGEAGALEGAAGDRSTPRPGGAYRIEIVPGNIAAGEFVEIEPPRRLVYTWGWEPGADGPNVVPPGSSTVEIELVPEGGGTKLLFTHRDLPTRDSADRHGHGWNHYLERLGDRGRRRRPGSRPVARGRARLEL